MSYFILRIIHFSVPDDLRKLLDAIVKLESAAEILHNKSVSLDGIKYKPQSAESNAHVTCRKGEGSVSAVCGKWRFYTFWPIKIQRNRWYVIATLQWLQTFHVILVYDSSRASCRTQFPRFREYPVCYSMVTATMTVRQFSLPFTL